MAKYIGCVEHNNGHITRLRVYEAKAWTTKSRWDVVSDIDEGTEYFTWYKNQKTGKYETGAQVHVVRVNGVAYLKTDKNGYPADNLGSLPTLESCPF